MLSSVIFILVSVWVILSILLYVLQPRFIYFPYATLEANPGFINLNYDDVFITTTDNIKLHGWYLPHENSRATLLFLHGNAGNISHRLDSLAIFHSLGLSILIIDYRGYGQSQGNPSEQGTYLDAEAAWNYLVNEKKINTTDIIVFGRSLGGAVATWLASQHRSRGLILESTFTSVVDIGKHYYPYLAVNLLARIKYPTIDRIRNINCPLLIVHGEDDEIIPYKFGKALFKAALPPKFFLEIQGGHNDGFLISGETYINGLDNFISETINR